MALWKGNEPEKEAPVTTVRPATVASKPVEAAPPPPPPAPVAERAPASAPASATRAAATVSESVVAAGLVIDGKIQGAGHLRVSGQFNGDIHVDGNLTIEQGAKVTGSVVAKRITISGELHGNIDAATNVELAATGAMTGDLKASTVTVAAGARMRGQVEFGWDEKSSGKSGGSLA